jgi:hypothetical protein
MFCPRCGQQQVVEEVRFCPRCGFTLGFVSELLANNGMLPSHLVPDNPLARELSPRRRGLRQGGRLMLVGTALVPILALIVAMTGLDTEIILTGLIILIAGLARLLYAAVFEEGHAAARPAALPPSAQQHAPPPFQPAQPRAQLPQRQAPAPTSFRRGDTAELVAPPASVTENTTRLLDKQSDAPEG